MVTKIENTFIGQSRKCELTGYLLILRNYCYFGMCDGDIILSLKGAVLTF